MTVGKVFEPFLLGLARVGVYDELLLFQDGDGQDVALTSHVSDSQMLPRQRRIQKPHIGAGTTLGELGLLAGRHALADQKQVGEQKDVSSANADLGTTAGRGKVDDNVGRLAHGAREGQVGGMHLELALFGLHGKNVERLGRVEALLEKLDGLTERVGTC